MIPENNDHGASKNVSRRAFVKTAGLSALGLISTGGVASPLCAASPPDSFQIVLLPDTQVYTRDHPEIYKAQTRWIRNNIDHRNIKFVIHLGDLVQEATNSTHWRVADEAMATLDGPVPYTVVPGNHEMPVRSDNGQRYRSREMTKFARVFDPGRFESKPGYGGHMGDDFGNNYFFFEAGGMEFMVVGLEHYPRDKALEWANNVVTRHSDRRVIVATHWYLFRDGTRHQPTFTQVEGNSGEEIWQKFVCKHENIFLVVSGHISGQAKLTSTNDAGNPVHQILTDFQRRERGGNGYLRTLKFIPARDVIEVETYSPTLVKRLRGPEFSYTLSYEMPDPERC